MSESKYERLEPQPGKQTMFLETQADICLYGGGAGSGKTFSLLLECLRHKDVPNFFTFFLRRTKNEHRYPGGPWDESFNIFSNFPEAEAYDSTMKWVFKNSNARVQFAGIELEKDLENFKGSQVPLTISGFME